ncbi:Ribosome biogenesis protein Nop16 family-containing protein [Strongyloides ratti]|uniref:Ribosome biogenesis protein Nop16 family-containing protein n=1 Tax=Strongyloides ratti TaxID=34506 RepID=A0A090L6K0_STRRB|nr:Ribosome biogenesis protein Nop16 family-containing protein [Strongyloides ratti]CEF65372.1 Ribosome biogenesis protein Nop16 family-containing protein [Strongyloides ratti]
MRSVKSVRRNCNAKYGYKNVSNKKGAVRKALLSWKEWKKSTYSNSTSNKYDSINEITTSNVIYSGNQKTEPNKIKEKVVLELPETEDKTTGNCLSVNVTSNGLKNVMKIPVDSDVVTSQQTVSGSLNLPSQMSNISKFHSTIGAKFFESVLVYVKSVLNSTSKNTLHQRFEFSHSTTRQDGRHKLAPRDIRFCADMLDKYGEDFNAISESEDNVFMDTPRGIEKRIELFKESPEYELYKKAKKEGRSFESMLVSS